MITKLRRKFVLINMLLVCAVLLAVFTAFCVSNHGRLRAESVSAMQNAVGHRGAGAQDKLEIREKPMGGPAGNGQNKPFSSVPVFWVALSADGTVGEVQGAM